MANRNKIVFVTVGTTSFDKLISTVDSTDIKKILMKMGFKKIVFQIGQGNYEPINDCEGIDVEYYRMKPSIKSDIENSELVICHAGAGSVLETMGANKPCIVVINENLMGNHQVELAKKLSEDKYLLYSTCSSLSEILETANFSSLHRFPSGNPQLFVDFLNRII